MNGRKGFSSSFNFDDQLYFAQDAHDFETLLEWPGVRDRFAPEMGFECDFRRIFFRAACCLAQLQNHFIEGVNIIVVENNFPRLLDSLLGDFFRGGFFIRFGA